MELHRLRTFLAVLRAGTITAAATSLDLAPSTVSAQIRALEDDLGVALFDRTPTGMCPTSAGARMQQWAQRLLDQAEQAHQEVAGHRRHVRLGALETLAATYLPRVLTRLAARHPDTTVEVHPSTRRTELFDAVAAGDLDAGLLLDLGNTLGTLGFPAPVDLAFLDLDPVPLALVASPAHTLATEDGIRVADLTHESVLVTEPGCSFRLAADHILGSTAPRREAGSVTVAKAWAGAGLGIALLPQIAVEDDLSTGKLALLNLDAKPPDLRLRLVWHPERENEPDLRRVLYATCA